jgi:hypothetical protein
MPVFLKTNEQIVLQGHRVDNWFIKNFYINPGVIFSRKT